MTEKSKESIQGVVFETEKEASEYGKGGISYKWIENSEKLFPQDVHSLIIVMPVNWGSDVINKGISIEWNVATKNQWDAQWKLSGIKEKPTLTPSLDWKTMWHGHLIDGFLKSC